MKCKHVLAFLILFPGYTALAQSMSVTDNLPKIILPANYNTPEFRKRLVDEAMRNSYKSKGLALQTEVTKQELKKSRVKWLDYIMASGNLNEFTIRQPQDQAQQQQANFYPRYNFGISFSLGSIFANANDVQIAKRNIGIAQTQENDEKIKTRSLVLSKFEEYVEARDLLKLQIQIVADEETGYKIAEKKFRQNQLTLEDFNQSAKKYNTERYNMITIRKSVAVTRYQLEGLIGAQIEDNI
ncbi:MAG: TolC family protein [Mucilaginibacter polytrichastri]|nr:TolC family protein [Mucilaginibacter polytrichastri]